MALKVLPDVFADDPERLARFQREARVLASLNHPNIASIYGLEESGDTRALVLELVEGPTLAERIAQGAIPVEEALPIAKQIADALEAAHEAGVIHRDLKPANVKVRDDGMVKVLDFGLAKALKPEAAGDPSELPTVTAATKMGVIMGTAAYMSPEQARGKPVDKRSDIWAFGCLMFEVLTGRRAFDRETLTDTLAAVIEVEPSWEMLPAAVPTSVQRLLRRCLRKDPLGRLRDIGEARIEIGEARIEEPSDSTIAQAAASPAVTRKRVGGLGRYVGVAALVVTALLVGYLASGLRPTTTTEVWNTRQITRMQAIESQPSLSPDGQFIVYTSNERGNHDIYWQLVDGQNVQNLTESSEADDYQPAFSPDGSRIAFRSDRGDGGLYVMGGFGENPRPLIDRGFDPAWSPDGEWVVGRTSAFQFSGKGHDLRDIGEKLQVKTILEGSVRRAGDQLRVNAQLINAADGYHLWSERYDRDMDDIFAVQDDIARTVVEKLKVKLLGTADTPLVRKPTDNLEAYNLVLQGRYYYLRATGAALEKSLACFTQALAVEPTYAQAHAGIALVHAIQAIMSLAAPHTVMPEAKEAALKTLVLDETVADAHAALAVVLHFYDWDWAGAEREYRRALELNPGDTFARCAYANLLGTVGRVDESVAEARSAVEHDPVSPACRYTLQQAFVMARRFEEAIAESHAGIELDPSYHFLYMSLGWGLAGLGRHDEAVDAFRQQVIAAAGDPVAQGWLGWALGLAGHRQEALTILGDLEGRRSQEYVGGLLLACVSLGLDEHDQAISWLQEAAEERDGLMALVNTLPVFGPLRSDPRFQDLLRRMNFPQ